MGVQCLCDSLKAKPTMNSQEFEKWSRHTHIYILEMIPQDKAVKHCIACYCSSEVNRHSVGQILLTAMTFTSDKSPFIAKGK